MNKKIYIAGRMKLPHNHDKRWGSYMLECLTALMTCDGIYMLDGWNHSTGALIEHAFAVKERLKIMEEETT